MNLRSLAVCLAVALSLVPAAPVRAQHDVSAQIQALAKHVTLDWAATHPTNATELGITGHDAQWDDPSPAARLHDIETTRASMRALDALDLNGARLQDRDDVRLLRAHLTARLRDLTVYRREDKDYSAAAQTVTGTLYTQFLYAPVEGINGATASDVAKAWDDIAARLQAAPAFITASQRAVTHPGHLFGLVGAKQLAGSPGFLNDALSAAAKHQMTPARFAVFAAARDRTVTTIKATKAYIDAHVAYWPENFVIGRAAYDAMLRDEQLIPFNADQIAQMGRDELAHGWADQPWAESAAAAAKTPLGPETGGGMAPSGTALVAYYRDLIGQLKTFMRDHDVVTVPAWLGDIEVVETPEFLRPIAPGPANRNPRIFAKETKGIYFITPIASFEAAAKRLDLYEDFDRDRIWSSAAHETIPGHFMQFSIAHRHPDFVRRVAQSGSFAEGWAFYGEEMMVKLGLYGEDLDARVAVAQWERIRGCRAIVDGKLATGEWSYAQAAQFFGEQTGASKSQAEGAVADIALGPGYVVSYTVGRLQLENLFAEYRARTGSSGSLRDFHDRLLSYGTIPFTILGPELLADLKRPASAVRAAAHY